MDQQSWFVSACLLLWRRASPVYSLPSLCKSLPAMRRHQGAGPTKSRSDSNQHQLPSEPSVNRWKIDLLTSADAWKIIILRDDKFLSASEGEIFVMSFFLYMRTCLCCLLWSFHIQTLRNGWIWAAVQTVQCFQGSNHNNRSTSILIKSWSLPPFQVHSSAMFLSLVLLKTWTLNGHLCRTVCEQPVISTLMKSIILLAVKCSPCKDSLSCSNDAVKDRRRCHGRVDNKSESLRPMLK